jgi:hypothetical protein
VSGATRLKVHRLLGSAAMKVAADPFSIERFADGWTAAFATAIAL